MDKVQLLRPRLNYAIGRNCLTCRMIDSLHPTAAMQEMSMPSPVRSATLDDVPRLLELLMMDALHRHADDPILWAMSDDALRQIEKALIFALTAERQPFRQSWLVAENEGRLCGVIHTMLLPIPPIYAGGFGEPGLILPDSFVVPDAPRDTVESLMDAAEHDLREAGAQITLSSFVTGEEWRSTFRRRGYEPLTLYLSRTNLGDGGNCPDVRSATETDLPGIVARSAENRRVLFEIDPFWAVHPEADTRFSAWMMRSLMLPDRDMLVVQGADGVEGYAIAQPASRLHFPPAHDITGSGVIDDYYHPELADPAFLANGGAKCIELLRAAEVALAARGIGVAFVVCPAGWRSKVEMLEAAGYETAMIWSIRR